MISDLSKSLRNSESAQPYTKRSVRALGVVIHHVAGNMTVTQINDYHISKGWYRIGYHFFIEKDGTIKQVNEVDTISYHTKNNNTKYVGICLNGNFEKEEPTKQQISSLRKLISIGQSRGWFGKDIKLHKDLVQTSCPGINFKREYTQGISKFDSNTAISLFVLVSLLIYTYIKLR